MEDKELVALARKMMTSARPPMLDLYERFIQLISQSKAPAKINPPLKREGRFNKKVWMRNYMRDYRRRQKEVK